MENEKVQTIKNEDELPKGRLISSSDNLFQLSEKTSKEILVWDVTQNDTKIVWLLCISTAYKNNNYMQLEKDIQKAEFRIVKRAYIERNVLNALYDRRLSADSQKVTSDDSIVVGLFQVILQDALIENVSDIHIEVRPTNGIIRMRKNGEMMEYNPNNRLKSDDANNLCSVIYNVLASTKSVSFDPRDCQQGAVNYSIGNQELKLRYQSVPAYPDGFDVVLRVLPVGRSEDFTPLQKLGYTEYQVAELINISSRPIGSLIIAGVTGSGKSTTLKNLLMYINASTGYKMKIYSIEDPPEYNIAKITQIPVVIPKDFDPATSTSPFEKPIKACMRGDPDIIMIGEVRDKITGDLTKKAIQSGHQVLTTVHTTSALGIVDRFQDFGLTNNVLGSPDFLTGLLYQKLVPIVCDKCCIDFHELINSEDATPEDLKIYNKIHTITGSKFKGTTLNKRNSDGCSFCKKSGIMGRSVVAEVIMLDFTMLELITEGKVIELLNYWRGLSDGNPFSENMRGKTCMEHGFQKVLSGQVCPYDLEQSFKPIEEMLMNTKNKEEDQDGWANI